MTVIVVIDEPTVSRASIQLAEREAAWRGTKLLAVGTQTMQRTLAAPAGRPPAGLRTAADEHGSAQAWLRDAVADALGDAAADVELKVTPGLPGRVLVDTARERSAELIVLASRGSVSHLVGAMTQYVLRHAPCPVLLVPQRRPGTGGTV